MTVYLPDGKPLRRAKQRESTWWDTRYLEELVARAVLDGASGEDVPWPRSKPPSPGCG